MQRTEPVPRLDGRSASRACLRARSAVTLMKQLSTGCSRSTRSRQASTKRLGAAIALRDRSRRLAQRERRRIRHAPAPRRHPARAGGNSARRSRRRTAGAEGCARRRNPLTRASDRSRALPPWLTLTPVSAISAASAARRCRSSPAPHSCHDLRRQRLYTDLSCVAHLRALVGAGRRAPRERWSAQMTERQRPNFVRDWRRKSCWSLPACSMEFRRRSPIRWASKRST